MRKVRLTVTQSRCRCGLMKEGQTSLVGDACPPVCHELWNTAYPYVFALQGGADLDAGDGRASCFEAACPDGQRVRIRGEAVEDTEDKAMDAERFLDIPLSALRGIRVFAEALGECRFGEGITVREAAEMAEDREEFLSRLRAASDRYERAVREEVREFGSDADPFGLRYQWGDGETNEKVVRLIEESEAPPKKGCVVFYGPSNIAQWYSLERDMLPYAAYNHGIGGCIDEDMIRYAPRLLYPYEPCAVFFQTGSNDIASGIPLDEILSNKRRMYALFLENMPRTQLVVCSGLPLPGRTRYWDATVKTNELLRDMCEKTDRLHFLDATDAMLSLSGPEELKTSDGRYFTPGYFRMDRIHLNKRGHDVWTALMKAKLKELL